MKYLIFGDSHSAGAGSPGYRLGELLAKDGHHVYFDAKGGRSAHSYWHSEDGIKLIAADVQKRPDVVVIILGTNDATLGSLTTDAKDMKAIVDTFEHAGAKVYIVGPPYWPPDIVRPVSTDVATLNANAAKVVTFEQGLAGKRFIDARPLTSAIGADGRGVQADGHVGVHFTGEGAQTWAVGMHRALVRAQLGGAVEHASLALAAGGVLALLYFTIRTKWRQRHARKVSG